MAKLEFEPPGSHEVGRDDADRRSTPQLPGNGQLVGAATMGLARGDLDDPGPRIECGGCFREPSAPDRQRLPVRTRTETRKQLRKFRIGKRRVQFGQVPQGEASWHQIPYHNESGIEIGLRVIESPSWIALDRSYFRAQPGEEGTLLLGVFTEPLEGEIKGTLTLGTGPRRGQSQPNDFGAGFGPTAPQRRPGPTGAGSRSFP